MNAHRGKCVISANIFPGDRKQCGTHLCGRKYMRKQMKWSFLNVVIILLLFCFGDGKFLVGRFIHNATIVSVCICQFDNINRLKWIMDYFFVVKFIISSITIFYTIKYSLVNANDAEFGRVITFDNFDHFKVSSQKYAMQSHC